MNRRVLERLAARALTSTSSNYYTFLISFVSNIYVASAEASINHFCKTFVALGRLVMEPVVTAKQVWLQAGVEAAKWLQPGNLWLRASRKPPTRAEPRHLFVVEKPPD